MHQTHPDIPLIQQVGGFRFDAVQTSFLAEQLVAHDTNVYSLKTPEFLARDFIPTLKGIPSWAGVYLYTQLEEVGGAKFIAEMADDLPSVDVIRDQATKVIKPIGASYYWDVFELERAAATGQSLESAKSEAARRKIDYLIDYTLVFGAATHGLDGLMTISNTTSFTATTKSGGGLTWGDGAGGANATGREMVADVYGAISASVAAQKQATGIAFQKFTVLMPIEQYNLLASTPMGDGLNVTALGLLTADPRIEDIQPWYHLDGAASGPLDVMIVYPKHEEVVGAIIPKEFTVLPAQARGLRIVHPCLAATGGVVSKNPYAIVRVSGI